MSGEGRIELHPSLTPGAVRIDHVVSSVAGIAAQQGYSIRAVRLPVAATVIPSPPIMPGDTLTANSLDGPTNAVTPLT